MKTILTCTFLVAFSVLGMSQNELTVFSEEGRNFFLTVNGIQQNKEALARVTAKDLSDGSASILIRFEDAKSPDMMERIAFLNPNTEVISMITLTKKGYKLRYFGENPKQSVAVSEVRALEPVPFANPREQNNNLSETVIPNQAEHVEIHSEMRSDMEPNSEKLSMNVGINGMSLEVNMNYSEGNQDQVVTTTATTTTTTVVIKDIPVELGYEEYDDSEETLPASGCQGATCDHRKIAAVMQEEAFEDDRMSVAEQAIADRCLSVAQIKDLAALFTFEENRLNFVKSVYPRTTDPENFYELNSSFTFSDSKEELNRFLKSQR